MKKHISVILSLFVVGFSFGSEDSLKLDWNLRLGGRWQTGNLGQFGINASTQITAYNSKFSADLSANYMYLDIGFKAVDDLWLMGNYRYRPQRKNLPTSDLGSWLCICLIALHIQPQIGVGAGVNIIQKTPFNYFRTSLFAGYSDFKFLGETNVNTPSYGTISQLSLPIAKTINFVWELATYHSITDIVFWGINNTAILHYQMHKNISLNISHNTIYNNESAESIENTNTLMMFGIQFKTSK